MVLRALSLMGLSLAGAIDILVDRSTKTGDGRGLPKGKIQLI